MQSLSASAKASISESFNVAIYATPSFRDLFPDGDRENTYPPFLPPKKEAREVAAIYHSSGGGSVFFSNAFTCSCLLQEALPFLNPFTGKISLSSSLVQHFVCSSPLLRWDESHHLTVASEVDLYGKVYGVHGNSLFHVVGAFQLTFAVRSRL